MIATKRIGTTFEYPVDDGIESIIINDWEGSWPEIGDAIGFVEDDGKSITYYIVTRRTHLVFSLHDDHRNAPVYRLELLDKLMDEAARQDGGFGRE